MTHRATVETQACEHQKGKLMQIKDLSRGCGPPDYTGVSAGVIRVSPPLFH
jgi:hypothetical protein